MAERLALKGKAGEGGTPGAGHRVAWLALAAVLWTASPCATALDDPTRPPSRARSNDGLVPAGAGDLVLQSVIVSEAGRAAIINGALVKLGGKIGSARLVQVAESEVVVLVGSTPRKLALFPGVSKRPAKSAPDEHPNSLVKR